MRQLKDRFRHKRPRDFDAIMWPPSPLLRRAYHSFQPQQTYDRYQQLMLRAERSQFLSEGGKQMFLQEASKFAKELQ
jgi:hypothetical protein